MQHETISGYLSHIIYRNADNGYTVLELVCGDEEITATGFLPGVDEGEQLTLNGYYVSHPTYGEQFKIENYEVSEPEDLVGIERYLGSGVIKGIGPAMAARIVAAFKDDTLRVIDEEPERLAGIRGISIQGAQQIAVQVSGKKELRSAMMYLQKYGVSLGLAVRIYEKYGSELYDVIQTNPYKLADDIEGIGFKIADSIAYKMGFTSDSDYRICSGINYVLLSAAEEGHTYLPKESLMDRAAELLGVDPGEIPDRLFDLVVDRKVIIKDRGRGEIVYSSVFFFMERNITLRLAELDIDYELDEERVIKILDTLSEADGLERDEDQERAVTGALSHGVTVITGGPGTGKTTTINAVIRAFEDEGLNVALAAPTGRAAKRMTETTGHEAVTLHRLLEFQGSPEDPRSSVHFMRDETNPLDADVIIIDEMSMVDIFLMNALTRAVPVGARLILVGDANQLPSVGPGNILRDLIDSGHFHTVMLSRIFRQSLAGDIIVNAHKINAGEEIDTDRESKDFLYVKRYDSGHIIGAIKTLVTDKLPRYVHATTFDVQVLTPMRKGALGVNNLNKVLQDALNPPAGLKREKEFAGGILREGDKVMQIRNNYSLEWVIRNKKNIVIEEGAGIFNGDMGIITGINLYSEELTVLFDDGKEVIYPFTGAQELELAYAITVHKSQGSEYPAVIIPMLTGPKPLMNRNLIYTAVTRAKRCVCIVGDPEVFKGMVANDEKQLRYCGLADCISELLN